MALTTQATNQRDRRIGRAAKAMGKSDHVASRLGYSGRWQRMLNAGDTRGWPAQMAEIVDKLARDPSLRVESLIAGLMEIVADARQAAMDDACLDRVWLQACSAESHTDCTVDLRQLGLRSDPDDRKALETVVDLAPKQAAELLRLASLARVKLGRLS